MRERTNKHVQVIELLNKIHQNLYKSAASKNKENAVKGTTQAKEYQEAGEQRKPNFFERKRFVGYDQQDNASDEEEPQIVESKNKKEPEKPKTVVEPVKDKKSNQLDKYEDESYYDEEDAEADPWADPKKKPEPAKNQPAAAATTAAKTQSNQQPVASKGSNPFDKNVKPAFEDLDDIGFDLDSDRPIDFNNKKAVDDLFSKKKNNDDDNGLFVDNDFGDDDIDDDYEDDFEDDKAKSNQKKHDDIFNKSKEKNVVPAAGNSSSSSAADKGKKLPELGKNPQDSKGASEIKKEAVGVKATGSLQQPTEDDDDDSEPDQEKLINDQFQLIYDNDPELRQLLGNEISNLTLEEKYQIMTAYMNGGGVQALLGDDDKGGFDPEEQKMIEEQFLQIYEEDEKLR